MEKQKKRKAKAGYVNLTKQEKQKKVNTLKSKIGEKAKSNSKWSDIMSMIAAILGGNISGILGQLDKVKKRKRKQLEEDEELRKEIASIEKEIKTLDFVNDLIAKDFLTINKIENENTIVSDFVRVNDSVLGGYVVRDGPFRYGSQVKYKNWDNIQQAYGDLNYVIAYGSQEQDSHTEQDDRFIGYWDNFKLVPKGTIGDYEPFVDYKHNRVQAQLHTKEPLEKISSLTEYKRRPVSASYEDLGYGDQQIIGKIHHIAVSLDANEQDRCDTEEGTPCGVFPGIHDQNITNFDTVQGGKRKKDRPLEVLQIQTPELINDFTKKKVYKSGNKTPPSKKKIKIDDTMSKDKKKKKEDIEDEDEDEEEEKDDEMDMKTQDSKKMINAEIKNTPAAGDDDSPEDKIRGSNLFGTEKFITKADFDTKMGKMMDMIEKIVPTVSKLSEDLKSKEEKERTDLLGVLIKEPYNFPKDTIKDFTVEKLREQKTLQDSLPYVKDFKPQTIFNHEDVNNHISDFEVPQANKSPCLIILEQAQNRYKKAIKDMASIDEEK